MKFFKTIALSIALVCLVGAPAAAQKHAFKISVINDQGVTTYTKTAEMDLQTMLDLLAACQWAAARQPDTWIPNPDYDRAKPVSETNQPLIAPTGPRSVTMMLRYFLGEVLKSYDPPRKAEEARQQALKDVQDKIDAVQIK